MSDLPRPWVFPYPDREMYSKEQLIEVRRTAREEALEEAARIADDMDYGLGDLAAAIRALK